MLSNDRAKQKLASTRCSTRVSVISCGCSSNLFSVKFEKVATARGNGREKIYPPISKMGRVRFAPRAKFNANIYMSSVTNLRPSMQLQPEVRTVLSRAAPTTGCITEIWSSEPSAGSRAGIKCVSEINVLPASIFFRGEITNARQHERRPEEIRGSFISGYQQLISIYKQIRCKICILVIYNASNKCARKSYIWNKRTLTWILYYFFFSSPKIPHRKMHEQSNS